MKSIIAITSHETLPVETKTVHVERLQRRVLTTLRSESVSEVSLIVPPEKGDWSGRLLEDTRLSQSVDVRVVESAIAQQDIPLVAAPFANDGESVAIVLGDVFSEALLDRVVDAHRGNGTRPHVVLDTVGRETLLVCKGSDLRDAKLADLVASSVAVPIAKGECAMTLLSEQDVVAAEKLIRHHLARPGDGLVARYLNRPISTRLSRQLLKLGVSANSVTAFSIALGLLACVLNVQGSMASIWLGALLFHLSSVIDGCDGEIARATFTESPFGQWFDNVGDCVVSTFYVASFGIGFWLTDGNVTMLWLSLWGFGVAWVGIALFYLALVKRGEGTLSALVKHSRESTHPLAIRLKPLAQLFRREYFSLLLVVGVLFNLRELIVVVSTGNNTLFFMLALLSTGVRLFQPTVQK